MGFRNKLKYFLVHTCQFTNEQASQIIKEGGITINGKVITENQTIQQEDSICLNQKALQKGITHKYILFYKPKGIETTHNTGITDSFVNHFPELKDLFFAGRLDKDSEGLLLLTSDGKFANTLAHPFHKIEKEYIVDVEGNIDFSFKEKMENGIEIMGRLTEPCKVELVNSTQFRIILKEGKNRQIRRMCYKLNYNVTNLKRIRIADWLLDDLKPGQWKVIQPADGY